jgi:hypothetical protein
MDNDDADEQKVEGGSVREAALTNLWLTALTQLRPTGPEEAAVLAARLLA